MNHVFIWAFTSIGGWLPWLKNGAPFTSLLPGRRSLESEAGWQVDVERSLRLSSSRLGTAREGPASEDWTGRRDFTGINTIAELVRFVKYIIITIIYN